MTIRLDLLRDPLADSWSVAPPTHDLLAPELPTLQFHAVHPLDVAAAHTSAHPGAHPWLQHGGDNDGSSFVLPRFGAALNSESSSPADTSPSMASEVAFISGVDAGGDIVGTAYWTWNSNDPATYSGRSNAHKWGTAATGTAGGTVTYYFDTSSNWTATEKAQMTACITLWSDIANIHFQLITNSAAAQITFTRGDDGQAVTPAAWSGTSQAGIVGGSTAWTMTSATVSIDTSVPGFGPMDGDFQSIGGYVWMTIEHELGHAIGLGHAGAYNGSVDSATDQFSAYDSRIWSIMSYIDGDDTSAKYYSQYPVNMNWGTASDGYGYVPTTPMILDDLAIQSLYGAATSGAYTGGQIFGFGCNITDVTEQYYDFTKNTNPVVTIWDSGTGNTLDLSGWSTASTIDLNPGTFSSGHGMTNNIAIAYGTKIDAADGGAGADTIIANTDADHLFGAAGNDTFVMGDNFMEADRLNGGAGTDIVDITGDYSTAVKFDSVTMINMEKIVLGAGFDYNFIPADGTVAAGKTLTVTAGALGTANRFTFNGAKELDGHFILKGGQGEDIITGGALSDNIDGGPGSDHLRGGGGADTFTYLAAHDSTSTTRDLILDFNAAQDKIDLWFSVASIHAAVNTGSLSTGSFDSQLASAVTFLTNHQAVLYTPNAGNLAGHTFLVVDVNGIAGYQAHSDLVIDLEQPTNIASFGASTFI
ncbi:MAG TPA: M10 family metallopeptidase [Rhizomicrobium sp.]|jgi:Ca2+-binding RTX toxin-like protein